MPPETLEALVKSGHLVLVARALKHKNYPVEACYQLKPVAVAMVQDWKRGR